MPVSTEIIELLQQVGFCKGLPNVAIEALATATYVTHYPAGAVIQIEGDPADAMYIVLAGRVKVARVSSSGREQVLNVASRGAHFNTVPMFDGGVCPANAEALGPVELLVLPKERMHQLLTLQPIIALALLKELSGRLRHLVDLVDTLALHTVQGRLAGLLLAQAEAAERGEIVVALTQAEMATRLGTVREMISRTLRSFEILGYLQIERGVINISDAAGLKKESEQ